MGFCPNCSQPISLTEQHACIAALKGNAPRPSCAAKEYAIEAAKQTIVDLSSRLAAAEAQLCRARGELQAVHIDASPGIDNEGLWEKLGRIKARAKRALSSLAPCRHEERNAALEEVAEAVFCWPDDIFISPGIREAYCAKLRAALDAAKEGK